MIDVTTLLLAALITLAVVSIAALITVDAATRRAAALYERLLDAETRCAELATALLAVEHGLDSPLDDASDDPHALDNVEPLPPWWGRRRGGDDSHWLDTLYRN